MSEKFSEFISCVMTAMSYYYLYSKELPAFTEFACKAVNLLDNLYAEDMVSITLLGGDLIFNDTPVTVKGVHIENFMKKLRAKGIERIIIKRGVSTEGIKRFILEMGSRDKTMNSSDNILLGTVQVRFRAEGDSILIKENISHLRDVYDGLSRFKSIDMIGLEDVVMGFIAALKREAHVLRLVSPLKSYSEYTYVHAANVSVITIFQAESLGLKGEDLRDAGLAGLLHDVGKVFVAKAVLEKQARLDESEWNDMKRHPIYGAMSLSILADVPRLAVIAAFEHHMRFDGSGYPDTKKRGKRQHIISQMVAIADFFDALRTERPYRRAIEVSDIAELLKAAAGKDFNPLLVDNFLGSLKKLTAF